MTNLRIGYPDIPYSYEISQLHDKPVSGDLGNLAAGARRNMTRLETATGDDCWYRFVKTTEAKAAEYLALCRADALQGAGVKRIYLRPCSGALIPTDVEGLIGWWDPTQGVTADSSNLVSQWSDLSGNGYNLTQSSSSAKPTLTRPDNTENLLLQSNTFENASWTKGRSAITDTDIEAPDGTLTARKLVDNTASASHRIYQLSAHTADGRCTAEIYAKAAELPRIRLSITNNVETARATATYDLINGTISSQTGGTYAMESVGNGWWKCTISRTTATGDTSQALFIYTDNGSGISYAGTGTQGVYIWRASLRHITSGSDYVETTTYPQIAGVNGSRALYFDGGDLLVNAAVGALLAGSDKPFTILMAVQKHHNSGSQFIAALANTGTNTPAHEIGTDGTSYQAFRRDDASTSVTLTGGTANASHHVLAVTFSGTTLSYYVDGAAVINEAAADVGTATFNTFSIGGVNRGTPYAWGTCKIGTVLLYDSALDADDRAGLEAFITSQWMTTPLVSVPEFASETLKGPREEDFLVTFTESAAFDQYFLQLSCAEAGESNTSRYPLSKVFMGELFDLGRDPIWGRRSQSAFLSNGNREKRYRYPLTWVGVSYEKRLEWDEALVGTSDVWPVILIAKDYAELMHDQEIFHCHLIDSEVDQDTVTEYTIQGTFEEAL